MNVSAVQIEVPEGQPPVPGADASIPANAYENYRHINKVARCKKQSYISQIAKSNPKNPAIYALIRLNLRDILDCLSRLELADYSQSTGCIDS